MEVAGEALDGSQIEETLAATNRVVDTMDNLFKLVKTQQQNYCDLGVRFALAQANIKIMNQQSALASG